MENKSYNLTQIAYQAMLERGLQPQYPKSVDDQLAGIHAPACSSELEDFSLFPWCSIDNDDSRDLDQLTYAKRENGEISLWVAIADVDSLVKKDTPIDRHAQTNTTTVYTPTKNFPMIPEKLSSDLTSLNQGQDRSSIVVKMVINRAGDILEAKITAAKVRNHAKLTYRDVGAWLENSGPMPLKLQQSQELVETLQIQHEAAEILLKKRYALGALSLETPEAVPIFKGERVVNMEPARINQAHRLIEHFMIAANSAIALFLEKAQISSLRRVVRVPKRWDRIVEVAKEKGEELPLIPDSKALDQFLVKMREKDPISFPDLSLTIVKLLGSGEYIVERPGDPPVGHFGLALKDYTHSTAPNRRYPDIITQRQIKALLSKSKPVYRTSELEKLAYHCTLQEDAASKVERRMNKSAAALLLLDRIGESFSGIVTGAATKGTWVRIFNPPTEGKVIKGAENLKVGDRVTVKLVDVDVTRGFIDFEK